MADTEHMDSIIEFSADISEAEAPVPLPATAYRASIVGVEAKTSQTSGKRYASVKILIPVNEYPADYPVENAPEGTTLTYNMVSLEDTPPARYRLRKFVEAIGAPGGKRIDLTEWMHREISVSLKHEIFDGINRAVVDRIESA